MRRKGHYAFGEFVSTNPDPVVQAWMPGYHAVYGVDPEIYASVYYDATKLMANAMMQATEITGPAIREAIAKTKDFRGVMTHLYRVADRRHGAYRPDHA